MQRLRLTTAFTACFAVLLALSLAACDAADPTASSAVTADSPLAASNAGGNGATVLNFGRDGTLCFLSSRFGDGEGRNTVVLRPNGVLSVTCNGSLDDPSLAPSEAVRDSGTCSGPGGSGPAVILTTPSGQFTATCRITP